MGVRDGATTLLVVDDEVDMRLLVRSVMALAGEDYVIVGEAADGIAKEDVSELPALITKIQG